MLNPDPAKLRYLGMDLHSRTRRRIVVVFTWIGFFIGMGMLTYELDTQPVFHSHPVAGFYLAVLLTALFSLGSVFREGGAVRRFDLPLWRVRGLHGGASVMLRDLDDWARYKHGAPLAELPEEQQQEVLRTYRVGNYLLPADRSKTPERPDEREIAVRDQASTKALKWTVLFCFSFAGAYAVRTISFHPIDVAMSFLTLGVYAFNGPASILLWNEPDPRADGELNVVEQSPVL